MDINHFYDRQKERAGRFATFVWIGSGIVIFWIEPGARFLSWQAALFFVVGMFVAAIAFGLVIYAIDRGITKLIVKAGFQSASFIRVVGYILMIVEIISIFLAARSVVRFMT